MIHAYAVTAVIFTSSTAMGAWLPQPTPPGGSSQPAATAAAPAAATPADAKPAFTTEELEQLAAPIALYPDSLVAQIFMASTYPLEVVEAERWVKQTPGLKGDALANVLNQKTWDASVKSLVEFPDVLTMMSEKLDWTTKLGDAFIAQQKDLMAAVQTLRAKAKEAGNLKSNEQVNVEVEQEAGAQVIVIESSSPEVIYVPQYDPVVVYGGWPYPAYPPYTYYPPGYVAGTALVSFGIGLACGAAWGHAWGNCNWGGGDVDIDINRNTNFNTNIDRSKVKNEMNAKGMGNGKGQWQHDSSHRKGASYRDSATAQKYGRGTDAKASQARDQYRGRAESGRQDISRGGADQYRGAGAPSGAANRPATADRGGGAGAGQRPSTGTSGSQRSTGSTNRAGGSSSSAFGGSNKSSSSTKQASSRGSSSKSSSSASRSSSSRSSSGGSRSSGGGRTESLILAQVFWRTTDPRSGGREGRFVVGATWAWVVRAVSRFPFLSTPGACFYS